ncbi:MAG: DUF4383 domain-containing protein [Actinomycetota bacterium]|nr:DUF4383 domain-containing protein [Actinomycetota bacterium]
MGQTDGTNVARVGALLLGLGYLAAGLIGFVVTGFTGFVTDTDEQLLGLDLNIFHNLVHLTIGAGLLVASQVRDVTITQGTLIGVGLFYILAALLGFIDYLQIISVNYGLAVDNFFHLATGLTAFIFGVLGARQQSQELRRSRGPGAVAATAGGPRPIEERRAQWDTSATYREETY